VHPSESENRQSPVLSFLIVAATLAALGGSVWALVEAAKVAPSLVASLVTGLLAIGGLVLGRMYESRKRIEQARRERLAPMYERILKMIYAISKSQVSDRKSIAAFEELGQLLMLWGTPSMVREFNAWRAEIADIEDDPRRMLKALERLLFAIRKDLGSASLNEGELLRIFVNDYEEVMAPEPGHAEQLPAPAQLRGAA
jgi:hypothetical protein